MEDMNDHVPFVNEVHSAGAYFTWGWKRCGFGELSFGVKDGKWHCDTECMGPESVRKLLHAFADHVADNLTPVIEAERAEMMAKRKIYVESQETEAVEANQEGDGGGAVDGGAIDERADPSE